MIRHIPKDIKIETLLDFMPEDSFRVRFNGLHNRNACHDIADMQMIVGGKTLFSLARQSLYNALPEYLFHPFDLFDQLSGKEMKERIDKGIEILEKEREQALSFFAPIDIALLLLRMDVVRKTRTFYSSNSVLEQIITDTLSANQRNNRFVRAAMPFVVSAKVIRGNKTFLTLMLRKIFKEENIDLIVSGRVEWTEDAAPRYSDAMGGEVGNTFAGNKFGERVQCFDVRYWSDEECNENFSFFLDELEVFRSFIKEFFLSVEEDLAFHIINDNAQVWLSSDERPSYLNYNTNL